MKRFIIILILLLVSCDEKLTLKEYLFQNQGVTIQIDNGTPFNRHVDIDNPELQDLKGKILTINKRGVKQEILLSGKWQQIKGTNYSVIPN